MDLDKETEAVRMAPRAVPSIASYRIFKGAIGNFRRSGTPEVFNEAEFYGYGETNQGFLMAAFRRTGLVDDSDRPTEILTNLVEAYETDRWQGALGSYLKTAYRPVFSLNLEIMDSERFRKEFARIYGGSSDSIRRAITFLKFAARDAGLDIGKIFRNSRKRSAANTEATAPRSPARENSTAAIQNARRISEPRLSKKPDVSGMADGNSVPLPIETSISPSIAAIINLYEPDLMPPNSAEAHAILTLLAHVKNKSYSAKR